MKNTLIICILLWCGLVSKAENLTLDLAQGDINISTQGYSHGERSENGIFAYTIISSTPTSNSLTISGGSSADDQLTVKLSDVNIDKDLTIENREKCGAPLKVSEGYVTLVLEGETTLKSISAYPGLALEANAHLTIEGDGTLKAYASDKDPGDQYTYRCGAGIGPDETEELNVHNGHLVINSGSVYGYSVGGGYGFGSGAGNYYNGSISGGSLTLNGGDAHFFGGFHPYHEYITEGIGTRNSGVELFINGGDLEAIIEESTVPYVDGVQATRNYITDLSPYYSTILPGMLGQKKCGVAANISGWMRYWTLEGETFDDFLDGRVLLQATNNMDKSRFHVDGLGLFMPGEETELKALINTEDVLFDHWSFGSTENPVKYVVTKAETIELFLKPNPQTLWTMKPDAGNEGECYAQRFHSGMYFDSDTLEVPENFVIDGVTYTVTELGTANDDIDFFFERSVPTILIIPKTIRRVSPNLFAHMRSMMMFDEASVKKVICKAVVPPALSSGDGFANIPADCELVVPAVALEAYKNDPVWGQMFSTISSVEGYEYVTIDISQGDVKISDEGYTIGESFTESSGPYRLTSSSSTANLVEIAGGSEEKPLDVALDNITIDRWKVRGNGFNIASGYVDLTLVGENNIRGGHDGAGIWLPAEATLSISGDGKLVSEAGSTNDGAWLAGAGIGGAVSSTSVGTLIINSGSVYGYGILGSAGFGSGSVWTYTDTFSENHGVLVMNGGEAHFYGSSDKKYNTVALPEGVGCAGNVPTLVYLNGGTLDATLKEGTPVITTGIIYDQYIQPGLTPNKEYILTNHLGMEEYKASTDSKGNLFYWLSEGQTRKDVTGYDFAVEVYADKENFGSVTGGDFYNDGDEAEIAFVWKSGNHDFSSWDDGTAENPYHFTVTDDCKFTAILAPSELRAWHTEIARDTETWELSETDCCVESFSGSGFDIKVLEVPSSFEINGKTYTTTMVGTSREGLFYLDLANALDNFILPETITHVSSVLGTVNTAVVTCLAKTPPSIIKDRHMPEESETGFYEINEEMILRVPFGTLNAYKEADGWKQFFNIEELRPDEEQWVINEHSDTEAHIYAYAHPEDFSKDVFEFPAVLEKDGHQYVVTSIGHPETGEINLQIDYAPSSLVIPASTKKVTSHLFGVRVSRSTSSLDNLIHVVCNAVEPPALVDVDGLNSFSNVPADATLIVPRGTKELYEEAPGWKEFYVREDSTSGITQIENEGHGKTEYYHIDGTRAYSLTPGLYIMRQGSTSKKVIIR